MAGIHVDRNMQELTVRAALQALTRQFVPLQHQAGFIFNAKRVRERKYYPGWSDDDRAALMRAVLSLVDVLGLSVSAGVVRNGCKTALHYWPSFQPHYAEHAHAFVHCLASANHFLLVHREGMATGLCVEDLPAMRESLKNAHFALTRTTLPVSRRSSYGDTTLYGLTGDLLEMPAAFRTKQDEPLLQIADCYAFWLRRYFADLDQGDQFILGAMPELPPKDLGAPMTSFTVSAHTVVRNLA